MANLGRKALHLLLMVGLNCLPASAQQRYVVIDQDGVGPGGSDIQSILLVLQSDSAKLLGVTVVSGDVWSEEGARHIRRALELVNRSEIPVLRGSDLPLIRSAAETNIQESLYGKARYEGAFKINRVPAPTLKEGEPRGSTPGLEGVEFLISMVHKYPHQVTIFAGGPLTNIALALRIDPEFASLARELVFMGGSLNPKTDDPEFAFNPRHEFNLWFDPEAAHIVLTAPWAKITETTVDVSLQAKLTVDAQAKLSRCTSLAAKYMVRYGSGSSYMWDELAVLAWLNPAVIRSSETMYVDVNLDHGYSYGDTITWSQKTYPQALSLQRVQVEQQLNYAEFEKTYLSLMCGAKP